MTVLETDSRSGKGVNGFSGAVRTALHDKIEAYAAKGAGRACDACHGARHPECGQIHVYQ